MSRMADRLTLVWFLVMHALDFYAAVSHTNILVKLFNADT